MWTNVFRIGELQAVSWFQFLPCEFEPSSLPEKRLKADQKDAANHLILSAHLQLQNEGFLSTWTNSFVGPWDPSQGAHNPDERIKLWLFLPGRHSSISESAHAAVSRLRVVGNGLWLAPGDSEEVGVALVQALRNSIERAFGGLSYGRFGDVFTRLHPLTSNVRRPQPTIEFSFTATEEAIYVHAVVSAKHIRGLCNSDIEKLLWHCSSHSIKDGIPVIVSPTGMRGSLTGCCPSDLVKQVYGSKLKSSNGIPIGSHMAPSSSNQLRGQKFYVEVTLGCRSSSSDNIMGANNQNSNTCNIHEEDSHLIEACRTQQKNGLVDQLPALERTFIYPAEAVLIPLMHRAFARSSNKSLWLRHWVGTSLSEMWHLWNFSDSSQLELCLAIGNASNAEPFSGLGVEFSHLAQQKQYNSSSNSITSSISSISRTSSESGHAMAVGDGDLEADADSVTCRQSGLSTNDQIENDGHRKASKRPRTIVSETSVQTGTLLSGTIQDPFASDYSIAEVDNSAAAGLHVGSQWDWDDDDRGIGMDIQALLSEFGAFDDFFEDDILAFGEPPGTAESQALVFPAADFGDITGSPCNGVSEVPEQNLGHPSIPTLEGLNHQMETPAEDMISTKAEALKDIGPPPLASSVQTNDKFDYLMKAEAVMTFAPEYAPVETPAIELATSIFKNPYLPRSKILESSSSSSSSYIYNATPPIYMDSSEEKSEKATNLPLGELGHDAISSAKSSKLYIHVASGTENKNKRPVNNDVTSSNGEGLSPISGVKPTTAVISLQKKNDMETGGFLFPGKTVFATNIECVIYQTFMCKLRHTLLSLKNRIPLGLRHSLSDLVQGDTNVKSDIVKHELRKKDNITVRLAGDLDGGVQDGPFTTQVGVWRSVGAPKIAKPSRVSESLPLLPLNTLGDEGINFHVQKQPLQDLLDSITFLVQQAVSLVDFSLDTNDGYGSYYWLGIQEQRRRNFSCGPSMIHAGCGGLLSTCHSLDIAGLDLIDPLSADIPASSVMSLLQSDIKAALKSAFGSLDGPLSVIDWCRGRYHYSDSGTPGDGNEPKDSSGAFSLVGEPISPPQSTTTSSTRERARNDESSQRRLNQESYNPESDQQKIFSRIKPTALVLPLPNILVGYQDDWLKTSVNSLRLWEKAPLEPYASPKPVTYYAICPDTDLLTSAAVDFFHQLGSVYEMCKLGSHSPQFSGGQIESSPGTRLSSGLVIVDCPQEVKIPSNQINSISSIYDYFLSLSKSWKPKNFINSLTKVIKELKFSSNTLANQKECSTSCTVVYVVCPFPDPMAILQTLVECSAALGSVAFLPDKDRRSLLYSQVVKALNSTAAVDEASASNVLMLSGFTVSKLVLQIITVETLLKIYRPTSELAILKDIAFTVYNKARRIPRYTSSVDMFQTSFSGRSSLMHVTSIAGLSKDCLAPRMSGSSLSRDGEIDNALRPGSWDNSWQTSRIGGLNFEQNRSLDMCGVDDARYMFEPLFILSEPGSVEHGAIPTTFGSPASESSSLKTADDAGGIYSQSSTSVSGSDTGTTSVVDGSEHDNKSPSLHCCYGWTEDWRWLVCIWTDARGEFLDSCIFPFGGISSRQDTKVLQSIFVQILQQGCQILSSCSDAVLARPRDIVITRFGCFFELECQEWQSAIFSFGGNDIKKWPLQLRRATPDIVSSSNNSSSLQQHDLVMIQERNLPTSPSPSLYSPHSKSSFNKSGMGQPNSKKQLLIGQTGPDSSRSTLQLIQSISLVGISIDHTLHLILQSDIPSSGAPQSGSSSAHSYLEGFSPVKSLGSMQASYLLIPSPNMRCLPPLPMHLPTCLTSESPPLAHLLHSKGSAIPLAVGYVVSKAIPSMRQDSGEQTREDWPSILSVSLVDHYGSNTNHMQERMTRGGSNTSALKQVRASTPEAAGNKDYELETHMVLESVAAELHSLSWMTVSPVYLERRTALPIHCDTLLRLRRLLHYADKELSKLPENTPQV
ncbi:mediator of RNA polymerase II transcription subunit 13-like [Zingiber officinale]|uniref:mediator of RNA polymerase II transcription subunit 13-like n=1 Tax=Zingiber officinale TaxID=94328 RepID=UPI001C4C3F27|nr:mediator of RNA polymerase II transcription subunit 13-like [Zingiber officinale]XP_042437384.1 mediator of RNA polymerase II transcription subunit 13-like [Zingiber officinale]